MMHERALKKQMQLKVFEFHLVLVVLELYLRVSVDLSIG